MIANGHRLADIWGYTFRMMQLFVDTIQKRRGQALHDLTVAIRHSQGTDAKVFKAFLESLSGES